MENFSQGFSNSNDDLDKLREEGYRITPQRKQLLELFRKLPEGEHLSADELFNKLADKNIKISLATLYRSLKFLVSKGFLRELDFGKDHKHYELYTPGQIHHHLVCNVCGTTFEFEDKSIYEQTVRAISKTNNFKIVDYHFKIFGICSECSKCNS